MAFFREPAYTKNEVTTWAIPNYWDAIALVLVFALIVMLAWSAKQMTATYHVGEAIPLSLAPSNLPAYAFRTVLRMFIALLCSLIFTFIFGTWAAKNKHAERLIIPIIDILQSVPILSFLSISVTGFILLFPNSMFGPECASIFVIFTSQVWNMTLSFYQGVKTVPNDLEEAANIFRLSAWQRFWRIEVPFSMQGLLWNMMMSMSGSWFFVTASEAISVANQNITLPGIGSYIALAIEQANSTAIIYAIIAMLVVIFLYDQLLFRPLVYWIERFKEEQDEDVESSRAWIVSLFQQTKLLRRSSALFSAFGNIFINLSIFNWRSTVEVAKRSSRRFRISPVVVYYVAVTAIFIIAFFAVGKFIFSKVDFAEIEHAFLLGIFTGIRVMVLIGISSLIWVPVGVWIGLRPRIATKVQPIVQFLAAFPANLLFPIVAMLVVKWHLNVEIWVAPLMVLGTQWYILFNVIAGASALPKELKLAAANFRVKGWLWWRRLVLPGIAPYFITGAITAAGGAWNASIVAEVINWGAVKLRATGLGAYIAEHTARGDFQRIALGTIVMCLLVFIVNRLVWRPLYNLAVDRFKLD